MRLLVVLPHNVNFSKLANREAEAKNRQEGRHTGSIILQFARGRKEGRNDGESISPSKQGSRPLSHSDFSDKHHIHTGTCMYLHTYIHVRVFSQLASTIHMSLV